MTNYKTNSEAILTQIKETQAALGMPLELSMDVQPTVETLKGDEAKFIATNVIMNHTAFRNVKGKWFLNDKSFMFYTLEHHSVHNDFMAEFFAFNGKPLKELHFSYSTKAKLDDAYVDEADKLQNVKSEARIVLDKNGLKTAFDTRSKKVVFDLNVEVPGHYNKSEKRAWKKAQASFIEDVKLNGLFLPLTHEGVHAAATDTHVHVKYLAQTVSQDRQGKVTYGNYGGKEVFDLSVFIGVDLLRFGKKQDDGSIYIDLKKAGGRETITASTSFKVNNDVFKGMKAVKLHDGLTEVANADRSVVFAIVDDIYVVAEAGQQGFTALQSFKRPGKSYNVVAPIKKELEKQAGDGQNPFDPEFYARLGNKYNGIFRLSVCGSIIKGVSYPSLGLKALTGYDFIVSKGNAKLMPKVGVEMDGKFAALNRFTKSGAEGDKRWTSYQTMAINDLNVADLYAIQDVNIADHKDVSQTLNPEKLGKMFRAVQEDVVDMDTSKLFTSTLSAIHANPVFANDIRISLGIRKMLDFYKRRILAGKLHIEMQYRIALADPLLFSFILVNNVNAIKAKLNGIDTDLSVVGTTKKTAIRKTDSIIERYRKTGAEIIFPYTIVTPNEGHTDVDGSMCADGNHSIHRHPKTHTNQNHVIYAEYNSVYNNLFKSGYHHNSILFSLFDLVVESSAGGDFDGDAFMIIFNAAFNTAMFKAHEGKLAGQRPLILDYAIDEDGILIGGCPWKEVSELKNAGYKVPEGFTVPNNDATSVIISKETAEKLELGDKEFISSTLASIQSLKHQQFIRNAGASDTGLNTNRIMYTLENIKHLNHIAVSEGWDKIYVNAEQTLMDVKNQWVLELKLIAIGMQWVLQYTLDKSKHGGAFELEMAYYLNAYEKESLASGLRVIERFDFDPSTGFCEVVFAESERGGYVIRKPKWLDRDAAPMFVVADMLAVRAEEQFRNIDETVYFNHLMSGEAKVAAEFDALPANHAIQFAIKSEIELIKTAYANTVSNSIKKAEIAKEQLKQQFLGNLNYCIDAVAHIEDTMSTEINKAADIAQADVLAFEYQLRELGYENTSAAIVKAAYELTYTYKQIKENTEHYNSLKVKNLEVLKRGLSFMWNACEAQLLEAFGRVVSLQKRAEIISRDMTHFNNQLSSQNPIKIGFLVQPGDKMTVTINRNGSYKTLGLMLMEAVYNGNPQEVIVKRSWNQGVAVQFVDDQGNVFMDQPTAKPNAEVFMDIKGQLVKIGFISVEDIAKLPLTSFKMKISQFESYSSNDKYNYQIATGFEIL